MKITIKNFQKKIPISPGWFKKAILKILSQEGRKVPGEITVCFVNDSQIKRLNLKYLRKNKPTDVLAFDLSGQAKAISADIIISADTAIRNAGLFKTTALYELRLYAVHGVLHLLGYDDRLPKQAKLMREKERKYVNTKD